MAPLTVLPFGSVDHNISMPKTNNGFQRRPYLISFFLSLSPTLFLLPFYFAYFVLHLSSDHFHLKATFCFLTLQPVITDAAALSVFLDDFS